MGKWSELAERVAALKIGESFDVADMPNNNAQHASSSIRMCKAATYVIFGVRTLPYGGGFRFIRTGTWGSQAFGIQPVRIESRHAFPIMSYKGEAIGQAWYKRQDVQQRGVFFMGFMANTSMHSEDVPEYPKCNIRACPFPAEEGHRELCGRHRRFFDYPVSLENRRLDKADLFSREYGSHPLFSTRWVHEDKWSYTERALMFDYKGRKNRGAKISNDYFAEIESLIAKELAPEPNPYSDNAEQISL